MTERIPIDKFETILEEEKNNIIEFNRQSYDAEREYLLVQENGEYRDIIQQYETKMEINQAETAAKTIKIFDKNQKLNTVELSNALTSLSTLDLDFSNVQGVQNFIKWHDQLPDIQKTSLEQLTNVLGTTTDYLVAKGKLEKPRAQDINLVEKVKSAIETTLELDRVKSSEEYDKIYVEAEGKINEVNQSMLKKTSDDVLKLLASTLALGGTLTAITFLTLFIIKKMALDITGCYKYKVNKAISTEVGGPYSCGAEKIAVENCACRYVNTINNALCKPDEDKYNPKLAPCCTNQGLCTGNAGAEGSIYYAYKVATAGSLIQEPFKILEDAIQGSGLDLKLFIIVIGGIIGLILVLFLVFKIIIPLVNKKV